MEITTESVKQLREVTGVSVMQCRKALVEAAGDLAKAEVILKKRSAVSASTKADRALKAGVIGTYVHDGIIGAMVLLSCETDFVAKNSDFAALAREVAMHVAATSPIYVTTDEIPSEERETVIAILQKEIEGKPAEMQKSILEGKLAHYFRDHILMEQSFIKDESKTIRDLVNEATQKFGERIEIRRLARFAAR